MTDQNINLSKRNHKTIYRALVLMLAFLLSINSFTPVTAYAKSSKKSRKIRLAIIGDNGSHSHPREKNLFEAAGASVTYIWSLKTKPSKYDGLIVPGGGDIAPSLYGKKRHPLTNNVNKSLDRREIYLLKKFAKAGKPVIGICKGCQAINVAYGGTLKQHIGYGHYGAWINVRISKKSFLYKVYGKNEQVLHYHHQAVGKLAKNFIKTMWTGKNIEGIQHVSKPIYGIQWHPDLMVNSGGLACAKKFIKICKKYRKRSKRIL